MAFRDLPNDPALYATDMVQTIAYRLKIAGHKTNISDCRQTTILVGLSFVF